MLSATSASRGTRLLQACAAGDRAAALEQLERGPPAAACVDAAGWSPALYAARHGWDDVLQALGPTDARLSSSGNTGTLVPACPQQRRRHPAASAGCCCCCSCRRLSTVLLCCLGEADAVWARSMPLLTTVPTCNLLRPATAALHIGALHGHLQVVRLLLQQLEQQQQQPAGGSSALPQRGCVDAPNRNADTPLMFAASAGHLGVAAALLKVRPSRCSRPASACVKLAAERCARCSHRLRAGRRVAGRRQRRRH